ncbi:MAG: segregation/condensation protein A, partial [Candidatus Aenigmatarchaeota archaeon]
FDTKERRDRRKKKAKRRVEETMPVNEGEDIDDRIDNLYTRITGILEEMKEGETKFSSLVPEWNREEIVKSFFPLLHLNQNGKVRAEQEEFFEEIFVRMNDNE